MRTEEESNDICKEVRCVETDESTNDQTGISNDETESVSVSGPAGVNQLRNRVDIGLLEQNFQDLQNTINSLVTPPYGDEEQEVQSQISNSTSFKLTKSRSCRPNLMISSAPPEFENTPPNDFETRFPGRPEVGMHRKQWDLPPPDYGGAASGRLLRSDSQSSLGSTILDDGKNKTSGEEDIPSVDTFVAGLKKMAKLQYDQV